MYSVEDVAEFIEEKVRTEYSLAVDYLYFESADGGWQGATTWDTAELLRDEVGLAFGSEDVFDDIVDLIGQQDWCDWDPGALAGDDELAFDWKRFCDEVKHHCRYVFFKATNEDDSGAAYRILERLGEIVAANDLITIWPAKQRLIRARVHRDAEFTRLADLGPPPTDLAWQPNKMSPAGIPLFYAALEEDTALCEVFRKGKDAAVASLALFELCQEMRILNLVDLPPWPSIFNDQQAPERWPLRFLHRFTAEIAQPIRKGKEPGIEWVPTQVVTEFFRHVFRDAKGQSIHGMLYPSAAKPGGRSCVIFCSAERVTRDHEPLTGWPPPKPSWLSLCSAETRHRKLGDD